MLPLDVSSRFFIAGDMWMKDLANIHPNNFTVIHSAINKVRSWKCFTDLSCSHVGGDQVALYSRYVSEESAPSFFRLGNGRSMFR